MIPIFAEHPYFYITMVIHIRTKCKQIRLGVGAKKELQVPIEAGIVQVIIRNSTENG